jgi:hypothetical protein
MRPNEANEGLCRPVKGLHVVRVGRTVVQLIRQNYHIDILEVVPNHRDIGTREDRSMTVNTFNTPSPIEVEAAYFWLMARRMRDARRGGNDALASEYIEALELVADMGDHAAARTAAQRSLAPLPAWVPSVVLKFPVGPAPRRREAPQPKRKTPRRA